MLATEADWDREHSGWMRVEEFQDGGQFVIRAEIPGIDPSKDVEVSLTRDTLHIRAERQEVSETTEKSGYRSEFRYGSFDREFVLPEGVSENDITASYRNGILEVRVSIPEGGKKASSKVIAGHDCLTHRAVQPARRRGLAGPAGWTATGPGPDRGSGRHDGGVAAGGYSPGL